MDDNGILLGIVLWTSGILGMLLGLSSGNVLITQIAGTATLTIHALLSSRLAGFVKLVMGWYATPFHLLDRGWVVASRTAWLGAALAWASLVDELLTRLTR